MEILNVGSCDGFIPKKQKEAEPELIIKSPPEPERSEAIERLKAIMKKIESNYAEIGVILKDLT